MSDSSDTERSVGLVGATAIGIGGMVGGGIFAVLGVAAQQAGGATPISFAIAGAVAALTATSYAHLIDPRTRRWCSGRVQSTSSSGACGPTAPIASKYARWASTTLTASTSSSSSTPTRSASASR